MEPSIIGFVAIGILVVINIVTVAYTYGKLSQSVTDLSRRVDRLETIVLDGRK